MKKVTLSLVVVGFISGCGSSGSSDSSDPLTSSGTPDENIVAVSGVYDTSRTGDEAYLYIAESGAVTAYDYQGEASGTGENCYSLSTASGQINSSLHEGTVTYSSTSGKYTLTSDSNTLEFTYDTTDGMENFLLDSVISSTTGLNISAANMNIKVGGDGNLQSSLLISDIESLLCN
ncbi:MULTISPECIES: hypothetical protein [unclassified Oleiphilus]|nr:MULTISPECIES: hypothetical protein [unclassified Oleiphilus]KZY64095.1 hypothetical protein A3738_11040 [Oleiphilus sp. HI0066]KZY69914.1 hypothetical protein A3739_07715 [Oleiphilus sp. HI0067]